MEAQATRKYRNSYRLSMILIVLFISLVPLWGIALFVISEEENNIEQMVTESVASISAVQVADIESFCESRKDYMEMLADYDLVADELRSSLATGTPTASHEYMDSLLQERTKFLDYILSLSIISRDFKVVSSSYPGYTYGAASVLEYSADSYKQGSFHIGHRYDRTLEDGSTESVVACSVGIYRDGELLGYMIEEVKTSYFDLYRENAMLSEGGTLYLTDGDEAIITAGTSGDGGGVQEYKTTAEERADYSAKWQAIDWETNPQGYFTYTVAGNKYITYYSTIKDTDWKIRISENISAYMARTTQSRQLIMTVLAIVTIILAAAVVYLSTRLSRPLTRIDRVLSRVREDEDYSYRINYPGNDEFGRLSDKIDALLAYAGNLDSMKQQKAETDPLSGLYNKGAIDVHMDEDLALAVKRGAVFAVGFLDIDDFKYYNSTYGHLEGDKVIQFVAEVLKAQFGNHAGRNGGDEFLFWSDECETAKEMEKRLSALYERLHSGVALESGEVIPVNCSGGVVLKDAAATSRKEMIHLADDTMYSVKTKGKNAYTLIDAR